MPNLPVTPNSARGPRVLVIVPRPRPKGQMDWLDEPRGWVLADHLSGDDPHNPRVNRVTDGEFLDLALHRWFPSDATLPDGSYEVQFDRLDPIDESDMKIYAHLVLNGATEIRVAGLGWVHLQLVKEDWR